MDTDTAVAPSPAPSHEIPDPDPPDDDLTDPSTGMMAKQHPDPSHIGLSPDFAALQGSNILLAMGVVLFFIGCGALVIGHTTIAALFIGVGLFTVIVAARLRGLATLTLEVVKVKATAKFGLDANDDAHGSDGSSGTQK